MATWPIFDQRTRSQRRRFEQSQLTVVVNNNGNHDENRRGRRRGTSNPQSTSSTPPVTRTQRKITSYGTLSQKQSRKSSGSKKQKVRRSKGQPAFAEVVEVKPSPNDLTRAEKKIERILRQFDLDVTFGPCKGITRQDRLKRSLRLGFKVNLPRRVKTILGGKDADKFQRCIWDQHYLN